MSNQINILDGIIIYNNNYQNTQTKVIIKSIYKSYHLS